MQAQKPPDGLFGSREAARALHPVGLWWNTGSVPLSLSPSSPLRGFQARLLLWLDPVGVGGLCPHQPSQGFHFSKDFGKHPWLSPAAAIPWVSQKMLDVKRVFSIWKKNRKGQLCLHFSLDPHTLQQIRFPCLIGCCSFSPLHYLLPHLEFISIWFNRVRLVKFQTVTRSERELLPRFARTSTLP